LTQTDKDVNLDRIENHFVSLVTVEEHKNPGTTFEY